MERYQGFGDKNQLFLGSDETEVKVSVVYNKVNATFRHFHKVEIVSVSPGKEAKAGNGSAQIELHELRAAGLSQSASSTCFDLSSSFGKSCFSDMPPSAEPKPCFHEPWLSQLFWCHDSWLLLSVWKGLCPTRAAWLF